jgi:glycosyltransferase involved in cell wall biosynthesis
MTAVAGPAAFVIPFWNPGQPVRTRWVREAIDSALAQTDPDVLVCVVVDDQSADGADMTSLRELAGADGRIVVVPADRDRGPGNSRNLGVRRAADLGCPFVCFLDSDDLAHPKRAAVVREELSADPDCSVVYAGFSVIDERGAPRRDEELVDGIGTIRNDIDSRPLQGYEVWIEAAVARSIITIPSSLNVRTALAARLPFPNHVQAHEDTHTWLRYSASGAKITYRAEIPSCYRIPTWVNGSNIRERMGGIEAFNRMQAQVILPAVREAIAMAVARGAMDPADGLEIEVRYLLNVAAMQLREGTSVVSAELVEQARGISANHCRFWLARYDLGRLSATHPDVMARASTG